MFTATLAALLAAALLLLFASTRTLAAVLGGLVLLVLDPTVFGGVLVLGLLVYGALSLQRRPPAGKTAAATRPHRGGALFSFVVLLVLVGAAFLFLAEPPPEPYYERTPSPVHAAPPEQVIALKTPGLLQVSELRATEVIDSVVTHSLFGVPVGETAPRVRVAATYVYTVRLGEEIRVVRQDGLFVVVVPTAKPNVPVAYDSEGVERQVAGTWVLLPLVGDRDLQDLERDVSGKLAEKAASREYLDRQREQARASMKEFVRSWLVTQTRFADAQFGDIVVYFEDERASAIRAL